VTNHPNQKTWLKEPETMPQSIMPRPNEHSALPAEYTKAQAIQICAKALGAMGLTPTTLVAWRLIADTTELSAWHSTSKTPINFRKVRDLACELGVSDRQWRRIEVQLEEHGLIARATSDNGYRGKAGGGALTFGLSLEPAIRNFAQLLELSKRPKQEEQARKLYLGKIRATRRRLKSLARFDPLSNADAARWATMEETMRPARLGYAALDALEPYLSALNLLEEHLRARKTPKLDRAGVYPGLAASSDAAMDAILPAEYTKAQAIEVCAKALAAMGLPSTTLDAWRLIADTTELSAWHSTSEAPINFRKVHDLASEIGVSDRQWRRIEVQLEDHGLIARATTDNGFRGKAGGGALTFGLSLEPAIQNFAQLLELSKRPKQEEQDRKLCLGKIDATRNNLKALASVDPLSNVDKARSRNIDGTIRPTPFKNDFSRAHISDGADTDVRCQYNLEYKQKHLNACLEGNAEENLQDGPYQENMNDNNMSKRQSYAKKTKPTSIAPDVKAHGCPLSLRKPSACSSDEIDQRLPGNTLIDLASITDIHKNQELLADIKLEKQGAACQGLDPQHIWARFRRYNLKRGKQILPVAALRAFIKGWIADVPQSYRSSQNRTQAGQVGYVRDAHTNKAYGAGGARPENSKVTSRSAQPHSRKEVLDYYAAVVNKGGYIPQTMISPAMMRELKETGRV